MTIVRIYILLVLLIPGYSCNKGNAVPGEYEVVPKTIGDRLFMRKINADGRIIGSRLNLHTDSTFTYKTCGNQMTGKWNKKKDSIILYVKTNIYRSDSMNSVNIPVISKEPIIFNIRKTRIYRCWGSPDGSMYIEALTKK